MLEEAQERALRDAIDALAGLPVGDRLAEALGLGADAGPVQETMLPAVVPETIFPNLFAFAVGSDVYVVSSRERLEGRLTDAEMRAAEPLSLDEQVVIDWPQDPSEEAVPDARTIRAWTEVLPDAAAAIDRNGWYKLPTAR